MGSLFGKKGRQDGLEARRLMPSLRRRSHVSLHRIAAEAQGFELSDFVRAPAAGDLEWYVALDGERTVTLPTAVSLDAAGIPPEQARSTALDNLRAATPKPAFVQPGPPGLLMNAPKGYYDTSRMLLPELFEGLGFGGEVLLMVPCREVLLLADSSNEAAVLKALEIVQQAVQSPSTLSGQIFRRRLAGWEPWELPSDHPGAELARVVRLIELLLASQAQEEQLKKLTRVVAQGVTADRPLYASMGLILPGVSGPEEEEEAYSIAVWVANSRSILPRAERIHVHRMSSDGEPEEIGLVPWERVEPLIGSRLLPLPYDPPCYLATGEVTAEELAALRG